MGKEKFKALFSNFTFLVFLLIGGVVTAIYLMYRAKRLKEERKVTIDKINEALLSGAGVENSDDASSALLGVQADANFDGSKYAKQLVSAIGTFWDDDNVVFDTIQGKTKAQLKSIENALKKLGYKSWDAYLKKIFDLAFFDDGGSFMGFSNCTGTDCGKYKKAVTMITSADLK